MTFEQAFLKIKEKFENADASSTDNFAIQITFSDEDCGGTFYAEVKDGKLAVEPYDYRDSDTVLDITKSALLAVLSGRSSIDKAVANGEAVVQGDISKITDWKNTIKKAPAKKTAEKKAAASASASTAKKEAVKAPAKPAAKTETKPAVKADVKPAVKAETKTAAKAEVKAVPKAETKTVKKAETKTASKTVKSKK